MISINIYTIVMGNFVSLYHSCRLGSTMIFPTVIGVEISLFLTLFRYLFDDLKCI